MHHDIKNILFTEEEIRARVAEIGLALSQEYATKKSRGSGLLLVSVLRGAAIFMADLARQITVPLEMDYMATSSYGTRATSSGVVRIVKDLSGEIHDKHVVLVEDILDSGLTLDYLTKILMARNPASLEVVTLLRKQVPHQAAVDCAHIGFECPNEFIVGYGLDFAERYRNLPYIGVLKPEVYQK